MNNFRDIDNAVKPELKIGGRVCQCTACGLFFTGVAPFNRHLVGTGREVPPICLTPIEMIAVGMRQNMYGVWQYGTKGEAAGATSRHHVKSE